MRHDPMRTHPRHLSPTDPPNDGGVDAAPPPRDDLDALLRDWHDSNRTRAAAGRDRLMASLLAAAGEPGGAAPRSRVHQPHGGRSVVRRIVFSRYSSLLAALLALAVVLPLILPRGTPTAVAALASNVVLAPEGGRLDALDADGNIRGPCALKHTDVNVAISGSFSRVTLRQQYHNPYPDNIEAVYTFPMSADAAVDRMTMTVGDRVIVGEVRERLAAREIYESARAAGRTASLLEQERPNIFTQSVANIAPAATVDIEISYVESIQPKDGEYSFIFPTVVGPRYIPGTPLPISEPAAHAEANPAADPPARGGTAFAPRRGLVLLAPATIDAVHAAADQAAPVDAAALAGALAAAAPIAAPDNAPDQSTTTHTFTVKYADGSSEPGLLRADHTGHIAGRWFHIDADRHPYTTAALAAARSRREPGARVEPSGPTPGAPFAQNTSQVPDASRITPMPARPPTRPGHDLSITVTIDTGGPGITALSSPLHSVLRTDTAFRDAAAGQGEGLPRSTRLVLANQSEIPNRDFVLNWRLTDDAIADQVFTHTGDLGNFFSCTLQPPARIPDTEAVPRELIFVLDTSGSMDGVPMEMSKRVMQRLLEGVRERDTFNIITFAGDTAALWNEPRPATKPAIDEAWSWISSRRSGGGTEMMDAIETALAARPPKDLLRPVPAADLLNLPTDGRALTVKVHDSLLVADRMEADGTSRAPRIVFDDGREIQLSDVKLPQPYLKASVAGLRDTNPGNFNLLLTGSWTTREGKPFFSVTDAALHRFGPVTPDELIVMPPDGREVDLVYDDADFRNLPLDPTVQPSEFNFGRISVFEGRGDFAISPLHLPVLKPGEKRLVRGLWTSVEGRPIFRVTHGGGPASQPLDAADIETPAAPAALRIAVFLTDGKVGNDFAIIDAVKKHRATTRVFAFGIGTSVNRFLIDRMARDGGGEAEYVVLEDGATEQQAAAAADRFAQRAATPVLADIQLAFEGVEVTDLVPVPGEIPDVFSERPLTILGRYLAPGSGQVVVSGRTGAGPWSRTIPITLPDREPANDVVATLWARAKINRLMSQDLAAVQRGTPDAELRNEIVRLGETHSIMSQYTSFVAVDKLKVTIAGEPRLVPIPVALPDRVSWEGIFGLENEKDAAPGANRIDFDQGAAADRDKFTGGVMEREVSERQRSGKSLGFGAEALGERLTEEPSSGKALSRLDLQSRVVSVSPDQPPVTGRPAPAPQPAAPAGSTAAAGDAAAEQSLAELKGPTDSPSAPSPPSPAAEPPAAGAALDRAAGSRSASRESRGTPGDPAPENSAPPSPKSVARGADDEKLDGRKNLPLEESPEPAAPAASVGAAPELAAGATAPAPLPIEVQQQKAQRFADQLVGCQVATPDGPTFLPDLLANRAVTVFASEQAQRGQLIAAQTATELFLKRTPDDVQLQKVVEVVSQPKQSPDVLHKQMAVLGQQARAEFENEAALLTKLDRRLYLLIRPPSQTQAARQELSTARNVVDQQARLAQQAQRVSAPRSQRAPAFTKSGVLVSVRAADVSAATLRALRDAGLTIQHIAESANVVVGEIPIDRLEVLTLLPQVRRIEAVEE